jgi:hypothetical protein
MFLATLATKITSAAELSPLIKAVKEGLGVAESSIVFAISPFIVRDELRSGAPKITTLPTTPSSAFFLSQFQKPVRSGIEQTGDILATSVSCLDVALWKVGGAAIALRLVQIANVSDFHLTYFIIRSREFRHLTRFLAPWVSLLTAFETTGKTRKIWNASVSVLRTVL